MIIASMGEKIVYIERTDRVLSSSQAARGTQIVREYLIKP